MSLWPPPTESLTLRLSRSLSVAILTYGPISPLYTPLIRSMRRLAKDIGVRPSTLNQPFYGPFHLRSNFNFCSTDTANEAIWRRPWRRLNTHISLSNHPCEASNAKLPLPTAVLIHVLGYIQWHAKYLVLIRSFTYSRHTLLYTANPSLPASSFDTYISRLVIKQSLQLSDQAEQTLS